MARLGYVRNRAARAARARQAGSIALVVGEENVKVFADPFFARILWGVSKELGSADVQLVLLTLHSPRDYHTVSRYLRSGHVDGAFFVSMHSRPEFDLGSLGIPVVLCGRPVVGGDSVSYVDADNVEGAAKAVNYLLGSGRKAVATIAGPPDMSPGIDRLLGYRKAMTAAGVHDPGMIAYGDFSRRAAEHALCRLVDHRPGLDAVFVASDLMAVGGSAQDSLTFGQDIRWTEICRADGPRDARPGHHPGPGPDARRPGHRAHPPRLGLTGSCPLDADITSAAQCRTGRNRLPRIVLWWPAFTIGRPLLRRYRPNRSRPM